MLWREGNVSILLHNSTIERASSNKEKKIEKNSRKIRHVSTVVWRFDSKPSLLESWGWAIMWICHLHWGKCMTASGSAPSSYLGCRPRNQLGSKAWLSLHETPLEEMLTRSAITFLSSHTQRENRVLVRTWQL